MNKKTMIMVVALISLSLTIFASDFKIPHRFKAGDVISADVLNEIFDYIDSTQKTMTPSDLVGNWICSKYTTLSNSGITTTYPPGYEVSNGGLFVSMQNLALSITEDVDGSIKWSSPSRNAFNGAYVVTDGYWNLTGRYSDDCPGSGIIDAIEGDFAISYTNCLSNLSGYGPATYTSQVSINKISDSRLRFGSVQSASLLCDLQSIPPENPSDLTISNTGMDVALAWTDSSADESGFKIIRKDTLDGNWTEIAVTGANTSSYKDTVSTLGTYWYRVKSYNNNGSSLGSNVVKVTIE